jgi:hypothetical protein
MCGVTPGARDTAQATPLGAGVRFCECVLNRCFRDVNVDTSMPRDKWFLQHAGARYCGGRTHILAVVRVALAAVADPNFAGARDPERAGLKVARVNVARRGDRRHRVKNALPDTRHRARCEISPAKATRSEHLHLSRKRESAQRGPVLPNVRPEPALLDFSGRALVDCRELHAWRVRRACALLYGARCEAGRVFRPHARRVSARPPRGSALHGAGQRGTSSRRRTCLRLCVVSDPYTAVSTLQTPSSRVFPNIASRNVIVLGAVGTMYQRERRGAK